MSVRVANAAALEPAVILELRWMQSIIAIEL